MNVLDHYSTKLDTIRSIPDEKILIPAGIPVKIYIQEAENICSWCRADREKLTANGLDWTLVDDMPARIDALREAQARWTTSDSDDIEIEKRWDSEAPSAHEFRRKLVRSLRFALRNNPAVLSKTARFSSGKSHAAMIQSLRDMAVFGMENSEYLKERGFDMSMLDTASEISRTMGSIYAAVNTSRAFSSEYFKTRNQAYTYLREALDEIRAHAAFIFRNDPARYRGYSSDYYRKRNTKVKNSKKTSAPEEAEVNE